MFLKSNSTLRIKTFEDLRWVAADHCRQATRDHHRSSTQPLGSRRHHVSHRWRHHAQPVILLLTRGRIIDAFHPSLATVSNYRQSHVQRARVIHVTQEIFFFHFISLYIYIYIYSRALAIALNVEASPELD